MFDSYFDVVSFERYYELSICDEILNNSFLGDSMCGERRPFILGMLASFLVKCKSLQKDALYEEFNELKLV